MGKRLASTGLLIFLLSLTCSVGVQGSRETSPDTGAALTRPIGTSPTFDSIWLIPRLSEEMRVSSITDPERENDCPAAAYNSQHDEYLVVWRSRPTHHSCRIEARVIGSHGEMQSPFTVFSADRICWAPSVAYNAEDDVYLVAWGYDGKGDYQTFQIYARVVDRKGELITPARRIATEDGVSYYEPQVEWVSAHNQYVVVWGATDLETYDPSHVVYAELSTKLMVLHEVVVASDNEPRDPDIAYDPSIDALLIVWRERYPDGDTEILGAQFKGSPGILVDPPGNFVVKTDPPDQWAHRPRVASNQNGRYLVSRDLHALDPGQWDLWGVRVDILDETGQVIGEMAQWDIAHTLYPFVMADPGSTRDYFLLVESNYASNTIIHIAQFGDDLVTGWPPPVSADGELDYARPAGAMGGANMLIVYEAIDPDDPLAYRHVYARICAVQPRYLPITLR